MASELRVTTIANNAGSESVDTTYVVNGSAKSHLNFNGTGTIGTRGSFNVSSIADRGTGLFTQSLTSSMSNGTDFMGAGSAQDTYPDNDGRNRMVSSWPFSASSAYVNSFDTSGNADDCAYISSAIHGDLA